MSQLKIKRDAFKDFKKRKKFINDSLRSSAPVVTLVWTADKSKLLCAGIDRELLAKHCATNGWTSFDMEDVRLIF